MMADQARAEFNDAMARLQPRLPRIPKRGTVDRGLPALGSVYSRLR